MSVEALWVTQFGDINGGIVNGGVLVLETGRAFGGDARYLYVGTYQVDRGTIKGEARIRLHTGEPLTAWGDQASDYQISFEGKISDDSQRIDGEMRRLDKQLQPLPVHLKKEAELPS